MTQDQNRELLETYIRCIHDRNLEALSELVHDDYVEEYPQSGERIVGKANFVKVYENLKGLPHIKGYNIECCGDMGFLEMLLDYPEGGTYTACEVVHFKDGKIAHSKGYFAEPFEAPQWRSEWVEMMGPSREEGYEKGPSMR